MKRIAIPLICMAVALTGLACITTKLPTGETTTRVDVDGTIAITQMAVTLARQGLETYKLIAELRGITDKAKYDAEVAVQQQRIDAMQAGLDKLFALKMGVPAPAPAPAPATAIQPST